MQYYKNLNYVKNSMRDYLNKNNFIKNNMEVKTKKVLTTLFFFFLAGWFEIGGGYLVWLWLREGFGWVLGALGGLIVFLYGVVPTFQPSHFHRIYASNGGGFIVMSILLGWIFDGIAPDVFDTIGVFDALIGVWMIFYWPSRGEKIWST